jgi:cytochrome-b5 reductase
VLDKDPKPFKVVQVRRVNHNCIEFVVDLGAKNSILGYDVSGCCVFAGEQEGKPVMRPYTPVFEDPENGLVTFVVKVYNDGVLSKQLGHVKVGDTVRIKGPVQKLKYEANKHKRIVGLVGGSGLTPVLQVASYIYNNPADNTTMVIVNANKSEEDIFYKELLDELGRDPRIKVINVVNHPPAKDAIVGRINAALLEDEIKLNPNEDFVYVCGPPRFYAGISGTKAKDFSQGEVDGLLKAFGFPKEKVFKF